VAVVKAKKCPTCIGIGKWADGRICPDCKGAGELLAQKQPKSADCRWGGYSRVAPFPATVSSLRDGFRESAPPLSTPSQMRHPRRHGFSSDPTRA